MPVRHLLLLITVLTLFLSPVSKSHELRPAYLSITEHKNWQYEILWKTPALGKKQLALKTVFPENCKISNGIRRVKENIIAIETWNMDCQQSLQGQNLSIEGLDKTLTDVLVRIKWLNAEESTARLTPDKTKLKFDHGNLQEGQIKTYFIYGVQHILAGFDHLLFVFAIMLLIAPSEKLFWTITAFTLGHSITLGLASFGLFYFSPPLIETLIAISIILLAYEVIRHQRGLSGLTLEYPWLVTFGFGLLHGFGFAGALRDIGLPQQDLPIALLFFNLGVEVGQLLFISAILVIISLPFLKNMYNRKKLSIATSYLIGSIAVFWMIERAVPIFHTG